MAEKIRPPKPVGPRVKDEKAYEKAIKKEILEPLFSGMLSRLEGVPTIKQAYVKAINDEFIIMTSPEKYGFDIAAQAMDNIRRVHKASMVKAFRSAIGVDITPLMSDLAIRPIMNQALLDNIALIKSIPKELNLQIVEQIQNVFETKGFDQQAIIDVMQKRFKVAGSRAKLIARDQTSKIIGNLNKARQTNLGITSYTWQTVEDERVRDTHVANNGKTFLWSAPPPETGHPGHDINCRCLAISVLPALQVKGEN